MAPDLDRLEAFYSRIDTDRGRAVVAVVAELRAAREVIGDARLFANTAGFAAPEVHAERRHALLLSLAAYDRLTEETTQ